jgi:hypothetical protein
MTNKIIKDNTIDSINSNNINRGKPIYFKNIIHYIVYEFEGNIIISENKDLSKAYCVSKSRVSVKPTK